MRPSKEETEASRSGSFKEGQEWGKKCFEDLNLRISGKTSNTQTEYGLSPPRKLIESRRNREMFKKQVHTMATAEKIAPGGDCYISLCTADAKVRVQKSGGVHVVSEGA